MTPGSSAAARRTARVRASLAERELDAALITHPSNIRYLTGFTGSAGWLLLEGSSSVFMTDGRYEVQASDELAEDLGLELTVVRDRTRERVAERVQELVSGRRVGFEGDHVPYATWHRWAETADSCEWVAISGLVEDQRCVKDEEEIARIGRAIEITETALADVLARLESGAQELEIAAELDHRMRRLGADGTAFETLVASGPRSALPHARAGRRRIGAGDLLLIDIGARFDGYCADLTRTFVVGQPTDRQVEVFDAVTDGIRAALDTLKAGTPAARVDEAVRATFRDRGLEDRFAHSSGHGIGLEVHEAPRLSRRSEEELRAGMVVTVEPGLYFSDWGGIRIENDYVVTSEGARRLSAESGVDVPTLYI